MKRSFFITLISLVVVILYKPDVFSNLDLNLNFILPLIGTTSIVLFLHGRVKITKMWITVESLFLIGYIIVHFQIPFSHTLGWQPSNPYFYFVDKDVVNYGTWLSTMAILLWILGFHLQNHKKHSKINSVRTSIKSESIRRLKILIYILFPLYFISFIGMFIQGNYGSLATHEVGHIASFISFLLYVCIILYVALALLYIPIRNSVKGVVYSFIRLNSLISFIIIFYFLLVLSIGDRGPIIQVLSLSLFIITYKHVKINAIKFVLFIVIGASFMTVLKYGRSGGADVRGDTNIISHGIQEVRIDDSPFNPTLELAASNRILYRAIHTVPDKHPYLYGLTIAGNFSSVVPLLSGALVNEFNISEIYLSSTTFFTFLRQGPYPTSGDGSEILADIYINFGIWGVLIIMFLFGFLVSYLSNNLSSNNDLILVTYIVLLTYALYLNRAPLFIIVKPIFYMVLIYKAINLGVVRDKKVLN